MIPADFHTHTTFCDGENTPEEMVAAAIAEGMTKLGFSGHAHTPCDESYCMSPAAFEAYKKEVRRLREAYRGQIEIFLGLEQDLYADTQTAGLDYVIGSVHYVKLGDEFVPMDEGNDVIRKAAERHFGGDVLCVLEAYYETVSRVVEGTGCDVIGHFDLPTKYTEREALFDPASPRYRAAWQKAADALLRTGVPFEINTGAMARGCRSVPYPAPEILRYLGDHGGAAVLSGDSHSVRTLRYGFDAAERLAKACGIPLNYPQKFGL